MSNSKIILLATHNQGKLVEMQEIFKEKGYTVKNLDYLSTKIEAPEEIGITFEENALLKAYYVAKETGFIALADDSGLEISALKNAPSIYSARYATRRNDKEILALQEKEPEKYSQDMLNNLQVLKDMQNFSEDEQRKARFCCCLALVFPDDKSPIITHGYWEGIITKEIKGENGFGYDPIFFDPILGKTSAQLSKEEKMKVSHRAKAIEVMRKKFEF